jgi:hypothetical protein
MPNYQSEKIGWRAQIAYEMYKLKTEKLIIFDYFYLNAGIINKKSLMVWHGANIHPERQDERP